MGESGPLRLIDAHCHLNLPEFDHDRDRVVDEARKSGVVAIVDSGLGPDYGTKALALAEKFRGYVFPTVGLEPYNLGEEAFERVVALVRENEKGIVGVGEVGLDYYWNRDEGERRMQRSRFKAFIDLSKELDLPLIVHSRSAGKYAIQTLEEEGADRVLLHAFDGRVGSAMAGVELGYYFSIPTSVWVSRQKQKLAKRLPLSSIMVESDSPVLSPLKEGRNEPSNLLYAVRKIAEIKGVDEEDVAEETLRNASGFFSLEV